MKNTLRAGAILLAGIASVQAAAAQEAAAQTQQDDEPAVWRASAGANYSEGKYGDTATTKVVSAPVAIKYRKGGFSIRLSVPWVHIDGPGSILDTPQGRDAGFGDLSSGDDSSSEIGRAHV